MDDLDPTSQIAQDHTVYDHLEDDLQIRHRTSSLIGPEDPGASAQSHMRIINWNQIVWQIDGYSYHMLLTSNNGMDK